MSSNTTPEPRDVQGYFNRGVDYLEKGKLDDAIADLSKAIELEPRNAVAYFNRGVAYFKKGELDKSIADFSKSIELNPRDASAYAARGFTYNNKAEWDKAIEDFNKAIELNPQDAGTYFNRGVAYGAKGELDNAIADFSKATELEPQNEKAHFARRAAYIEKEEWDKAIADFNKAIELNPQNAGTYFHRGTAYGNKGELDNAIADFTKAIELNPEHADAYYNRGLAYYNKGELDTAITDFDKAIKLNLEHANAYFHRGLAYGSKGELDTAIDDFSKAIELDPQNADAYYNRGHVYRIKAELDTAITDFDKAIKLNPEHANAYNNRGVAYGEKGAQDKAFTDFDKAIALDPQNADAYNNRGVAYGEKGAQDKAFTDFDKAIALDPQNANAYFNRGVAYGAKGELGNAIADFSKATEINPQHANAYAARGHTYLIKKEWSNAFKDFVRAGKKDRTSKSKYTEVYVASTINDVVNNGGNPAVIEKHPVVEIFLNILKITTGIQNMLFHKPYEPKEVAHYTSLDTLKSLVSKGGFRLYNAACMDDREEGGVFFEIMKEKMEAEEARKYLKEEIDGKGSDKSYRSPAYIGSFIPVDPAKPEGDIYLWEKYGKGGTGSCLIFPRGQFAEKPRAKIGYMWMKSMGINSKEKQDSKTSIHKIIYIDTEKIKDFSGIGAEIDRTLMEDLDKMLGKLAKYLERVGGIIESMPDDTEKKLKQLVRELLDSIRFLFKASDYRWEKEARVLQLHYPEENTRKSDKIKEDKVRIPPCFYWEASGKFHFNELILGSKVQNFQVEKQWIKERDPCNHIKIIRKSKIPYSNENT